MASGSGEGGRLYADDMYSDFDVVDWKDDDLERSTALAEAVRTSQLARRVPSSSLTASSRPPHAAAPSSRRSTEMLATSRSRLLGQGVFDSVNTASAGPPLTAIQRAGYSSAGGPVSVGCSGIPGREDRGQSPTLNFRLSGS